MEKLPTEFVKNPEAAVLEYCQGEEPKQGWHPGDNRLSGDQSHIAVLISDNFECWTINNFKENTTKTISKIREKGAKTPKKAYKNGADSEKKRPLSDFFKMDAPAQSKYCERKKIPIPIGIKFDTKEGCLCVPVLNPEKPDELMTWQRIWNNGTKLFLKGYHSSGFFKIGKITEGPIWICEGLADGASIHRATKGRPVFIAFNKAGILRLYRQLCKQDEGWKKRLYVALDNDGDQTLKLPHDFPKGHAFRPEKPGDFNDHEVAETEKLRSLKPAYDIREPQNIEDLLKKPAVLTNKTLGKQKIERITPLRWPQGCLTIVGADTGIGKTTAILSSFAPYCKKVQRPFVICTNENSIRNLIQPWWEQFGGDPALLEYPTHPAFKNPEDVPWDLALPLIMESLSSGKKAGVFIDLIYQATEDDLDNRKIRAALSPMKSCVHIDTAFLGSVHLKKDRKGQELLSHILGGTGITGTAEEVRMLRKAANDPRQRVMATLKSRLDQSEGGDLIRLPKKDGEMEFERIEKGSHKEIFARHAEKFAYEAQTGGGVRKEDVLAKVVHNKIMSFPHGTWPHEAYMEWAKEILGAKERKARELLRLSGHKADEPTGFGGKRMIR